MDAETVLKRPEEPEALDLAIARAWPDGVPAVEEMVRARLTTERADKLARRLEAIRSWTEDGDDERPRTAAEAASLAGVAISQFHALVGAWRRERSLASLGVHAGGRRAFTRSMSPAVREDLVERVRRLLSEEPDMRPLGIRERLEAVGAPSVGEATMLRVIAEARRRLPPGRFGGRLVFDSAGLDFVDPEGLRVRLYGVVDHGTGLVLGWAVGTDRSRAVGHVWAAHDALDRLADLPLSGLEGAETGPIVDLRLHADDVAARRMMEEAFGTAPSLGRASRTLGSTLVGVLGERIGDLWLGTGERAEGVEYRTGRRVDLPEYRAEIAWTIDPAIEERNAARLALLPQRASRPPPPEEARERVAAALRQVIAMEARIAALPDYAWMPQAASPDR